MNDVYVKLEFDWRKNQLNLHIKCDRLYEETTEVELIVTLVPWFETWKLNSLDVFLDGETNTNRLMGLDLGLSHTLNGMDLQEAIMRLKEIPCSDEFSIPSQLVKGLLYVRPVKEVLAI